MSTDKERLFELFASVKFPLFEDYPAEVRLNSQIPDNAIEYIVDYFLTNGVIVPPCKVGDTVYLIKDGLIEPCEVEGVYYTRRKNYVRIRPFFQEYIGNWSVYYTPSIRSFGKIVFAGINARENAEKALAESKDKESTQYCEKKREDEMK